jgi:Protein of unknown function (DUF1552)
MANKTVLSRRAVLRGVLAGGAAVAIPLPRLGAMLNSNGTAYAAGKPIQRFGVFFIGNGVVPTAFAPKPRVTGPLGALTLQLSPFESVKSKITVVSGFDLHTGRALGVPHGHFAGALTACAATAEGAPEGKRVYQLPSIDQVIAKGPLGQCVPYKSLEVSVSNATPGVGNDIYMAVSGSPNAPNFPSSSPSDVFTRLFGKGVPSATPTTPTGPVDHTPDVENSVLDAVIADANDLQKRLGSADRLRLQSHLESIRALELRIKRPTGGGGPGGACGGQDPVCALPQNHADGNDKNDGLDGTLAHTMADLLVMAMACDMTRVFTYQLSKPAAHVHYSNESDLNGDFHGLCHGETPDEQPTVQKGVMYTMQYMAYLLQKMDAVMEGDATMLDNSTVLFSTCVAWGKTHTQYEWPCVIGGRGGRDAAGAFNLKGGWHYRPTTSGDNFSKVLLTLANINGAGLKEIGKTGDGGHTTEEAPGIRG